MRRASSFALLDLELGRLAGRRRTHVLLLAFGAALLFVFVAQHREIAQTPRGPYGVLGQGKPMLDRLSGCTIAALVALVALGGAGAIADERERGTLELLRASPLTAGGIVFAKLAALLVLALGGIAVALPSFSAAMAMGGVNGIEVLAVALSAGASAGVASAFSLLASAVCRRSGAALALSLALCGGAWLADQYVEDAMKACAGRATRPIHLVPAGARGALPGSVLADSTEARATLARSVGAWAVVSLGALVIAIRRVHAAPAAGAKRLLALARVAAPASAGHRAAEIEAFLPGRRGARGSPHTLGARVVLVAWFCAALVLLPAMLDATWPGTLLAIGWPLALLALALRGAESADRERRAGTLELLLVSPMTSRALLAWLRSRARAPRQLAFRALTLWLAVGVALSVAGTQTFAPQWWGLVPPAAAFPLMGLAAMRLDLGVAGAVGLILGLRLSPRHARATILAGWVAIIGATPLVAAVSGGWLDPVRLEPWRRGLSAMALERPRVVQEAPAAARSPWELRNRPTPAARRGAEARTGEIEPQLLVLASHLAFALLASMGVRLAFRHRANILLGRGAVPRARRVEREERVAKPPVDVDVTGVESGPSTKPETSAQSPRQ